MSMCRKNERRRRKLSVQSLERRQLLAGDLLLDAAISGPQIDSQPVLVGSPTVGGPTVDTSTRPAPSAGTNDPETGNRIEAFGNPDGSVSVTETTPEGDVVREETRDGSGSSGGSSFDPETGITTTVLINPDRSRLVTQTNSEGEEISRQIRDAANESGGASDDSSESAPNNESADEADNGPEETGEETTPTGGFGEDGVSFGGRKVRMMVYDIETGNDFPIFEDEQSSPPIEFGNGESGSETPGNGEGTSSATDAEPTDETATESESKGSESQSEDLFNEGGFLGFGTQSLGAVQTVFEELGKMDAFSKQGTKLAGRLGAAGNFIGGALELWNSPGTTNVEKAKDAAGVAAVGFVPAVGVNQAVGGLIDAGLAAADVDDNAGVGDVIGGNNIVRFIRAADTDLRRLVMGDEDAGEELISLGKASLRSDAPTVTRFIAGLGKSYYDWGFEVVVDAAEATGLIDDPGTPPEIPTDRPPLPPEDVGPIPEDVADDEIVSRSKPNSTGK